jgi:hypothetical protein
MHGIGLVSDGQGEALRTLKLKVNTSFQLVTFSIYLNVFGIFSYTMIFQYYDLIFSDLPILYFQNLSATRGV